MEIQSVKDDRGLRIKIGTPMLKRRKINKYSKKKERDRQISSRTFITILLNKSFRVVQM